MKLMKSILCGVVCFAFACLIGTSCSKKTAEEQQAKTVITLEVTAPQAQQTEAVDNAFAVVRARIERYGISDMTMQKMDNGRIQIDLPGVQDMVSVKGSVHEVDAMTDRNAEIATGDQVKIVKVLGDDLLLVE